MARLGVAAGIGFALCIVASGCKAPDPGPVTADEVEPISEGALSSQLDIESIEAAPSVADRPEADAESSMPGDAEPTAPLEAQPRQYAESARRVVAEHHFEYGSLVDGVFVPDFDSDAYRIVTSGYVDLEGGFVYVAEGSVRHSGEHACFEFLLMDGSSYVRSTSDPNTGSEFVRSEQIGIGSISPLNFESMVPENARWYFERADLVAPEADEDGVRSAVLDHGQVRALFEVRGMKGMRVEWPPSIEGSATLETMEDGDGHVLQVSARILELAEVGAGRPGETRPAHFMTTMTLSIEPLDPATPTVGLSTPRPQEGYCTDITAGLPGEWAVRNVDDAWLRIDESGRITGAAGCQTIAGTAEITYGDLVNVEVVLEGEPCSDFSFIGRKLTDLLNSGPRVRFSEDSLILFEPGGGHSLFFDPM